MVRRFYFLLSRYVFIIAVIAWVIAIITLVTWDCWANPLDCEGVHNADQRNYCRALSKQRRSYCNLIKNKDLRLTCRAQVRYHANVAEQQTRRPQKPMSART